VAAPAGPNVLVLDVDGVLCVPPGLHAARIERELGLTREHTREFFHGEFRKCLVGDADLKEAIRPFLVEWRVRSSVDEFLDEWFATEHVIDERIIGLVGGLRRSGIRCALATNQERYRLEYLRHQMGFAEHFDAIFGSAEIGVVKPEVRFFNHVAAAMQVAPSELMFFDDHQGNVDGARAAGWDGRLYTTFDECAAEIGRFFAKALQR
jgi:putative hydrolase of the HAD superfamily